MHGTMQCYFLELALKVKLFSLISAMLWILLSAMLHLEIRVNDSLCQTDFRQGVTVTSYDANSSEYVYIPNVFVFDISNKL